MKPHPEIPQWLLQREGLTQRQFKALKRRQIRDMESAAKDFRDNAAFANGNPECLTRILIHITALKEANSVKNWGR